METRDVEAPISTPELTNNNQIERVKKREDYIIWADYFMGIACLSAKRSKDPNRQVGACIVNSDNKIIGIGYNGMPNGCSDDVMPWAKIASNVLDTKYMYVCHAEMNAIMNKNEGNMKGCTIYVTLFPCNECTKLIIQAGITKVLYLLDKHPDDPKSVASRTLLKIAGIEFRKFVPAQKEIVINFFQDSKTE